MLRQILSLPRCVSLPACSSRFASTVKPDLPPLSEALKRTPDQRDLTTLDIIEERIKRRQESRELNVGGVTQQWNYRSEVVGKHGLDNDHRFIWMTYSAIVIIGFSAFVWVKSNVVLNRQEDMKERERIRKDLKLLGSDRRKVQVLDE